MPGLHVRSGDTLRTSVPRATSSCACLLVLSSSPQPQLYTQLPRHTPQTASHCFAANMALSIDQKRLKATKFPPEFDRKVDIEKVNIDLMKKWIAQKITDILGDEDDIVVETCYNLVEQNQFVSICMRSEVQQLLTIAAQNQGDPDPAHRLPQQGHSELLQGAMGPDAQRSGQPNGCSQGNARGKEGRITARAGRAAQFTFRMT